MTDDEIVIGFYEEDIELLIQACNVAEQELRERQIKINDIRNRIHQIRMDKKGQK